MNTPQWNTTPPPHNTAIWVTDGRLTSQAVFSSCANRWYVGNILLDHRQVKGWSSLETPPDVGIYFKQLNVQ